MPHKRTTSGTSNSSAASSVAAAAGAPIAASTLDAAAGAVGGGGGGSTTGGSGSSTGSREARHGRKPSRSASSDNGATTQGHLRVLLALIRTCVEENTRADYYALSPLRQRQASNALLKYIADRETRELTYGVIVGRMDEATEDQNGANVILHCIRLLKNVGQYPPEEGVLSDVSNALARPAPRDLPPHAATSFEKDVGFVRALIRRQPPGVERMAAEIRKSRRPSRSGSVSSSSSTVIAPLASAPPVDYPTSSPLSLFASPAFGGQFRRNLFTRPSTGTSAPTPAQTEAFVPVGPAAADDDGASMGAGIQQVGRAKRSAESQQYLARGLLPRQSPPQLFSYRDYSEQQPIRMEPSVIRETVALAGGPTTSVGGRLAASKVLVKILMDAFAHLPPSQAALVSSLLLKDLVAPSGADARKHAFNIVFNCCVHAQMLDGSNRAGDQACDAPTEATQHLLHSLYLATADMLLFLVHDSEESPEVWSVACTVLLFLLFEDGQASHARLKLLDVRVIMHCLKYVGGPSNSRLQRTLVQLLVDRLYLSGSLDRAAVQQLGGVGELVHIFSWTMSYGVRSLLFRAMIDYIAALAIERGQEGFQPEHVPMLVELLHRYHLPLLLPLCFRHPPPDFTANVVRFAFFEQLKKVPAWNERVAAMDKRTVVTLVFDLVKLATRYNQLQPEFLRVHAGMTKENATQTAIRHGLATLDALIASTRESDRRQAANWLARVTVADAAGKPLAASIRTHVRDALLRLAKSKLAGDRFLYLRVVERTVLSRHQQLTASAGSGGASEAAITSLFQELNERISHVLAAEETVARNLVTLIDMVFQLIAMPVAELDANNVAADSTFALFLRGDLAVPRYLLPHVNMAMLHYCYTKLPSPAYNDARTALLLLIVEKTRQSEFKSDLSVIGGMNFFKDQLLDRSPDIAFHASHFIIEHLQRNKPQLYHAHLNRLIAKAQSENDPSILENPYLQVRQLLATEL